MGDDDETASPASKPPPELQRSVHSEPEEPADSGGSGGADQDEGSRAGDGRD
jgi:hypothetical protein